MGLALMEAIQNKHVVVMRSWYTNKQERNRAILLSREQEKAMIDSLKEAFNEVAQLPEDEQRHIVEMIRKEMASEKRWQTLFHDPRSEHLLGNLVAEAHAEETEEINGETFLS